MPSRTTKEEPLALSSLSDWEQTGEFSSDFELGSMLPNLTVPSFEGGQAQPHVRSEDSAATAEVTDGTERMSSKERRQHKNALAQKRLRDKKKVCPDTLATDKLLAGSQHSTDCLSRCKHNSLSFNLQHRQQSSRS